MLDENQANENETSTLQLWQEGHTVHRFDKYKQPARLNGMKHVSSGVWQGENQTARDSPQQLAKKQKPTGEGNSPVGLVSN
jgi:hypothetical protein